MKKKAEGKRRYCAWPDCGRRLERGRTHYCNAHRETWPSDPVAARMLARPIGHATGRREECHNGTTVEIVNTEAERFEAFPVRDYTKQQDLFGEMTK